MATIKYTSYSQIEQELEILKLEKEINYNKIKLGFEKAKDSIIPSSAVSVVGNLYKTFFTGTYGVILKTLIPLGVNFFIKRNKDN